MPGEHLADGGMRDALSILDQAMGKNKQVNALTVCETVGMAGSGYIHEMAGNIADRDPAALMKLIAELYANSKDMIRLCDELIGYFQYFVNAETFMMEEIQLKPEFHGTGVFEKLYEHLYGIVPKETPFAEAYAHKLNLRSQGILLHLGLEPIGENRNGSCLHYRGSCAKMFDIILKRGAKN